MAIPTYLALQVNGVNISNVQEFTLTQGVQKISDPLRAGTGVIRGRRPDLLPAIEIGHSVKIQIPSATFWFRVSDFKIDYGIVSSLDTWEIEIEDVMATLGRLTSSYVWTAGSTVSVGLQSVCDAAGVTLTVNAATVSPCSAQVIINENALEVFGRLNTQEQGILAVTGGFNNIFYYGRTWPSLITNFDASDDGTGTNPIKYDSLEFLGLADNYANNIYVEPAGLATQSAGFGVFSATFQTYNQTTGAAADLANFLLGVYDAQDQTPAIISAKWNSNSSGAQTNLALLAGEAATQLKIKFRGNTYYGLVIGYTINGRIDDIIFTYYLAAPAYYGQFTLNSSQYGVLNQNRLGY